MQFSLHSELENPGCAPDELRFHSFAAEPGILPTHIVRLRRCFERALFQRADFVPLAAMVHTVGFFRAFIEDRWPSVSIAADNALGLDRARAR
jgi:hypothetical protein